MHWIEYLLKENVYCLLWIIWISTWTEFFRSKACVVIGVISILGHGNSVDLSNNVQVFPLFFDILKLMHWLECVFKENIYILLWIIWFSTLSPMKPLEWFWSLGTVTSVDLNNNFQDLRKCRIQFYFLDCKIIRKLELKDFFI